MSSPLRRGEVQELTEAYVVYFFQVFQLDTTANTQGSSFDQTYAKYPLGIFRMHPLSLYT